MTLLQPEVRKAVFGIIDTTMKTAPWMFPGTIAPLIFMQLRQAELLKQARPTMLKQIELESTPDYVLHFAENAIVVPEKFNLAFKRVFPEIYSRVQQELTDKSRTEEVLIEIFTAFLMRWGGDFDKLEDHHRNDLDAMCGERIEESNRVRHTGLITLGSLATLGSTSTADFRKNKLPEEILHSVEQELRLRPVGREDELLGHAVGV